jgi:hypothetical protein
MRTMKLRTPASGPLLAAVLLLPLAAAALMMTGPGNDPVQDAGWPEGALAVANLDCRVGWWEGPPFGGGEWQFQYRGDTGGRVQIERLPAGSIRLSISAPGYAARALGQDRYGEHTYRQYQVELAGAASLNGVVQDAESQPLAGVKVRATNSMAIDGRGYRGPAPVEATTDAAGRFELAGLAVGYTQVRVRTPGYTSGDATIHAVPAADVVIRVGRTGRIVVRVVDAQGKALPRFEGNPVLVEVEPKGGAKVGTWGGSAQVKEDGTFAFTDVLPDQYRVWAHPNPSSADRQYAPDQFVRVEPGGKAEVRIVLGGPPVPTAKLDP